MAKDKERITPPSKKDVRQASKDMRKGSGPGGRVMADQSAAKRQGVTRKKP
jgi:hypothetical protein